MQELILIFGICFFFLVPLIFYLLTLQNVLERCSPAARSISPGKVWLMLIPIFNLVWHFFLVIGIAKSLRNEFSKRNLPISDPAPGKTLGLIMCILSVTSPIPTLGTLLGLAGCVCWILYWVKMSGYSRMIGDPLPVRA